MQSDTRQTTGTAAVAGTGTTPANEFSAELIAIFASSNERLLELQKQAGELAVAEMVALQAGWLQTASAMAELRPRPPDLAKAMRGAEIATAWFRVATEAQIALIGLIGRAALSRGLAAATSEPGSGRPRMPERRKTAVVIDFPDRRRRPVDG